MGGGQDVNEKNIKNILDVVGVDADAEKLKIVVKELSGKSIEELLAEGAEKLATMPAGGGGAAAAPAAGGAAPAERKKENPRNLTMTWDSVFSINSLHYSLY